MSEGPDADGVSVDRGPATVVLRNDSFRNLLWASATSSIGDWIGLFALIALAETLAGTTRVGALAVSFVMIARIVPTLFIAPIAGVFVDRWDRKRTMIVTDVVRGGIMLVVAFVGDAFQLVMATFAIEIAAALFIPAKDATVPTIVDRTRLVQANQLSLLSTYSTLPLGALLCAVVISATERVAGGTNALVERFPDAMTFLAGRPEAVPIILNALSFFVSIIFIQRMVVPDDHRQAFEQREESTSAFRDLKAGLDFIAGMPLIRALVVGIMTAFLAAGAVIGVGEFFSTITNSGEAGFALLGFIVGSGLVGGIASAGPLAKRIPKERLFAPGIMVAGVMLIATALMPTLGWAALPALLMGWGAGVSFILGYTMLQEYSEDEVRGRIFATFNTAVRAALFASLVLGPLSITVLGVERTRAQIEAGAEVEIDQLEDGEIEGTYPYQIGGVRITLIVAGLIAAAGAVWTGSSISGVLRERRDGGELPALADAVTGAGPDPDGGPRDLAGVFVVFEGGEGAGKTTQVRLLRAAVEEAGREAVVTREPGGTPTGEAVRRVLLDADGDVGPRAEALLYAAARAQHAESVLRPALERGAVVLCDRYVDSSIVYQGVGRGLGEDVIAELNSWGTDGLVADVVVVLDVPAEVGLRRARAVDTPDRLEAAGGAFHERVNTAFRARAEADPDRYLLLDATEPVEVLQAAIRRRVEDLLGVAVEPIAAEAPEASRATETADTSASTPSTVTAPPPPARREPIGAPETPVVDVDASASATAPADFDWPSLDTPVTTPPETAAGARRSAGATPVRDVDEQQHEDVPEVEQDDDPFVHPIAGREGEEPPVEALFEGQDARRRAAVSSVDTSGVPGWLSLPDDEDETIDVTDPRAPATGRDRTGGPAGDGEDGAS